MDRLCFGSRGQGISVFVTNCDILDRIIVKDGLIQTRALARFRVAADDHAACVREADSRAGVGLRGIAASRCSGPLPIDFESSRSDVSWKQIWSPEWGYSADRCTPSRSPAMRSLACTNAASALARRARRAQKSYCPRQIPFSSSTHLPTTAARNRASPSRRGTETSCR